MSATRSGGARARQGVPEVPAGAGVGRTAPYRLPLSEGPVYVGDGRYLLWSDIPNNRVLRWDEETGAVSIFRKPSTTPMATHVTARAGWSPASMTRGALSASNMTAPSQ